ncbi:non-specific serine/threonine protein kinase OS=Streptomyces microflavus OX=1919 GN=Smic_32790 PE=3 SV=1 [Streptomyces microflavus]
MPVTAEPDPPDYRQDLVAHPESLAIMRHIVSAHVEPWGSGAERLRHALRRWLLADMDRHTGCPHCTMPCAADPTASG